MKKQNKILLLGIFIFILLLMLIYGFIIFKNKFIENISYSLDYVSPSAPLKSEVSDNWITTSENGRYFVFEDTGDGFFPIGTALNGAYISYDATVEEMGNYLRSMNENGENFLRIDLEGFSWNDNFDDAKKRVDEGDNVFLENPPGYFNEEYSRRIDRLIDLAEENDIYIEFVIPPHTCTVGNELFILYPYHKSKGGPSERLDDLILDDVSKELYKQRIRYVVDRWGNNPNVFMWEIWNEIDNPPACGEEDVLKVKEWVEEIGNYIRDYEKERYGKAHLVGVSAWKFDPVGEWRFLLDTTGTDVLQTHFYENAGRRYNPVDNSIIVKKVVNGFYESTGKPYLENERAPVQYFVFDPEIVHRNQEYFIWSYLASGAAGGGALWHGVETPSAVAKTSRNIQLFLEDIDFANFDSNPFSDKIISSNEDIEVFAVSNGEMIVGWLMHKNAEDYEIDLLNWWRQGKKDGTLRVSRSDVLYIQDWKRILEREGVDPELETLIMDISKIIQDKGNINKNDADKLARIIVENPESLQLVIPQLKLKLSEKGKLTTDDKKIILGALKEIGEKIFEHFEIIERETSTLSKKYKGHPMVSTVISVNDFEDGDYKIKWYDGKNGKWLKEEKFLLGGNYKSPDFSRHVAFVIN